MKNFFLEEINELLTQYTNAETIEKFQSVKARAWVEPINYLGKLSFFDEEQLNVEFTPADDRMEFDKIITLAEKSFDSDKYNDFLLRLGQVCISNGKVNLAKEIFTKVNRMNEQNLHKANSLYFLANIDSKSAKWKNASENLTEAIQIFKTHEDNNGISKCENLFGSIAGNQGKLDEAEEHFTKAFGLADRSNEIELTAQIEMNLGIINNIKGNFDFAVQYLKASLVRLEKVKNLTRIAEARHNLGMMYLEKGEYGSALDQFDASIRVSIESGSQPMMGLTYLSKAMTYIKLEQYEPADAYATKSYDLCYGLDDKQSLAEIYKIKGIIAKHNKNYNDSENYFQSSIRLNEKFNDSLNLAETTFELAKLYGSINKKNEEEDCLNQALKYYEKIESAARIKELQKLLDNKNSHLQF